MEKGKQVSGAKTTASSFTSELFGPKDVSKSSSSSAGHFGALFGQSSTGLGKDSTHNGITRSMQNHTNHSSNGKQEFYGRGEKNGSTGKDPNSYPQNGSEEPCYFNSSIYYGGQEVYSPATAKNPNNYQHRKDSGDEDYNANNATRGNWWQGSLYY